MKVDGRFCVLAILPPVEVVVQGLIRGTGTEFVSHVNGTILGHGCSHNLQLSLQLICCLSHLW
jgi:hypothetical protein